MKIKELPPEPYVVGPNGEKRPVCPSVQANRVARVLLGLSEEEYVEDAEKKSEKDLEQSD